MSKQHVSLAGLNPPQREAAATLKGPLLVLAGAGTGKTRVVTFRVANLIQHGTRPERILAVTFTNKAASEMRSRVTELLGKPEKKKRKTAARPPADDGMPLVSTFHSLCVRILRRHIPKIGYPDTFTICDRSDQESAARQVLREIRVSDKILRPADLLGLISRWKSAALGPGEAASIASDDREHVAAAGYRRYQDFLKSQGSVDFDDLLLCTEAVFRTSSDALAEEASRFDHILIDEYQDTNGSQYRIIRGLARRHRNLCVVGDDDQSIYGWRGAEVKHILRFKQDWPEARVVRLQDNYRSTGPILQFANQLIVFNKTRHDKTLQPARAGGNKPRVLQFKTETDEAEQLVAEIERHCQANLCEPRDVAILFRTNEQPRLFETELRSRKIPYVLIGGMSFFDRREVKDIVAYLQLMVRPDHDPSLLRIINVPARGIARAAVQAITEKSIRAGKSIGEMVQTPAQIAGLTSPAVRGLTSFNRLMTEYRDRFGRGSMTDTLRALLNEIDYLTELMTRYEIPEERQSREAAVEQIVTAMAEYEEKHRKPSMQGFLDEISLANRDLETNKQKKLAANSVTLMTMHSAKGLEFSRVYMVGMEEGIMPHSRSLAEEETNPTAIEEERRLCYVGVTRAEDELTLSLALTRKKWGKARPSDASRFLFEMTGQAERFAPGRAKEAENRSRRRSAARRAATRSPGSKPTDSPRRSKKKPQ